MAENQFFEKSRLALLEMASYVEGENDRLIYENSEFKRKVNKLSDLEHRMLTSVEFDCLQVRHYDETHRIFIEKTRCDIFPKTDGSDIYYEVKTMNGKFGIPFFGGFAVLPPKVARLVDDGVLFPLYAPAEIMHLDFGFLAFKSFERIKNKCERRGYRINADQMLSDNTVCLANPFDISLLIGMITSVLACVSADKNIDISVRNVRERCLFSAEVLVDKKLNKNKRVSDTLSSAFELARIFKAECSRKTRDGRLCVNFALNIENCDLIKFRGQDEKLIEKATEVIEYLF